MDFPSPNVKADFVICFALAFESANFKWKTMKFCFRFLPKLFGTRKKKAYSRYSKTFSILIL